MDSHGVRIQRGWCFQKICEIYSSPIQKKIYLFIYLINLFYFILFIYFILFTLFNLIKFN
jgi:hypothetical protein